jgi:hypothetical protein
MLGQMQATACTTSAVAGAAQLCSYTHGHGFAGELQNMRVWGRELTNEELLHGMQWPFEGSQVGLLLYWRFEPVHYDVATAMVKDLSGRGLSSSAAGNAGHLSQNASLTAGTPSINPAYPCGEVYANIWHFSAPASFTGDQSRAYGGRLQYKMYSPSHNGRARKSRGTVVLFGGGMELSCPVDLFAPPSSSGWSTYSVVLREDHGWVVEPDNVPATTLEMKELLRNVSDLLLRGDAWVYSNEGYGQEVVYVNDIALYASE